MGLDVVWTNVEKIKGRIKIESEEGKGCSFILRFPLSLSTMQGLFVFANKDKFLIPSQYIVDIIYRKKSEYITLQNQRYIKLEGQLIPCFSLSSLFKEQKSFKRADADSILVAEYMEQRIGIVVEQVEQYVSLVVKPLPPSLRGFTILQGIVFDEHYDIVPILHVPPQKSGPPEFLSWTTLTPRGRLRNQSLRAEASRPTRLTTELTLLIA